MTKIDLKSSSARFIYPFLFSAGELARYAQNIDQATWPGAKQALPVWEKQTFSIDDLLPHVADFLNPPAGTTPTARLWCLTDLALQSRSGLGGGAKNPGALWSALLRGTPQAFHLARVELSLFAVGVGFLTFCATPTSDQPADWLDFVYYFRFMRGQRAVTVSASTSIGLDPQTRRPQLAPFFPPPAGGIAQHPDGTGPFYALVGALLQTAAPGPDVAPWWHEVFIPGQLLPFVTLYVDDLPEDVRQALLYRIHNFFDSRREISPAPQDLRPDQAGILPYADNQWFVFSLDGGAFVAYDAPHTEFFRRTMPDHLEKQYFLLFMLALEQRFALMMLYEDVARNWLPDAALTSDEARAAAFSRIRDTFLSFTARGYFTQVMQQEHHHRCYHRWRETFQVVQLYAEVRDAVREMYQDLQLRQTQRLQQLADQQRQRSENLDQRLSLVTWLIAVPSLAFFFIAAAGVPKNLPALEITLEVGFIALVLGVIGYLALSRRSKP